MEADALRKRLRGVIAFPVTPFHRDFSLDVAGLHSNLRKLMEHSLAAVVAAGGTGELYSLTPDEHLQVVKATVEEVGGRAPVIAGTGFNRQVGIELARRAADAGADAILALPPYYPNADVALAVLPRGKRRNFFREALHPRRSRIHPDH